MFGQIFANGDVHSVLRTLIFQKDWSGLYSNYTDTKTIENTFNDYFATINWI